MRLLVHPIYIYQVGQMTCLVLYFYFFLFILILYLFRLVQNDHFVSLKLMSLTIFKYQRLKATKKMKNKAKNCCSSFSLSPSLELVISPQRPKLPGIKSLLINSLVPILPASNPSSSTPSPTCRTLDWKNVTKH